jgi:hypothetical protein
MTKRRKAIAIALSVLVLVLVALVAVNRYVSDSFTLLVYEEGKPIADPSLNVPENARLTEAYSSKGHIREHDSRGDLIQSDFVFWLPVTVNAIKAPKQVTYRVLDDDMGISLPNGSKGSNLVVSGEDATGYMQMWFYVATHEESDGYYAAIPNLEEAAIAELQNPCLEVEVEYFDGAVSKKKYSFFPNEKNEYGFLDGLIVSECS